MYEVGPVFRAEPHATSRHLAEYVSLDAEFGFIADHTTVMALPRDVLFAMVDAVATDRAQELALLGQQAPEVPEVIPAISFTDAQSLLEGQYGAACQGELDLAPEHERLLGRWGLETHGSDFLFVTSYPLAKRPFYTHPNPDDPRCTNSFDLLFRGQELVTGGQRLDRYDDYLTALATRGLDPAPFAEYLEAFRFGLPPHGGFAIGLERFVALVSGLSNVRLATLFPRDLGRLTP